MPDIQEENPYLKLTNPKLSIFPWMAEAQGITEADIAEIGHPTRRPSGIYNLPKPTTGERIGEIIGRNILPFYSQIRGETPWLSPETMMEVPSMIAGGAMLGAVIPPVARTVGRLGKEIGEVAGKVGREVIGSERGIVGKLPFEFGKRPSISAEPNPYLESLKSERGELGKTRLSAPEWSKNPELVSDAKAVTDRITKEFPEHKPVSVNDLEYDAVQRFEDLNQGMHQWNLNKPGHPKDQSAVYGPAFPLEKGGILKSERGSLGGWYSTLENTIREKMPNQAPVEQVKALFNQPGVKADEVKWTGLDDYLSGKTGKISKSDVLDYLDQNRVEVREVTKGGAIYEGPTLTKSDLMKIGLDKTERLESQRDDIIKAMNEGISFENAVKEYASPILAKQWGGSFIHGKTKFSQWQLPGAQEESYRELLLTLPTKETWLGENIKGEGKIFLTKEEATQFAGKGGEVTPYKGTEESFRGAHYDEPNVLAHIRFNDRVDAQGKKVLFIEEVQSDWHQAGREKGYKEQVEAQRKPFVDFLKSQGLSEERINRDLSASMLKVHNAPSEMIDRFMDYMKSIKGEPVPEAPFSKTWHELSSWRGLRNGG